MDSYDKNALLIRRKCDELCGRLESLRKLLKQMATVYDMPIQPATHPQSQAIEVIKTIEDDVIRPTAESLSRIFDTDAELLKELWRSDLASVLTSQFCQNCRQSNKEMTQRFSGRLQMPAESDS